MSSRTAGCTAIRIKIDFLGLGNSLHLTGKIAHILCTTDAELNSVLFGMDFVVESGVEGLIVVDVIMLIHINSFRLDDTSQS